MVCIMAVVGIICEYNPFHEGHKYHIQKAKELTGADTVVAIMSGDFVQRGRPAVVDKYTRARMALLEGADLVFELPVRYSISSAEDFAYGGILALESLSFVDAYCFGSECGDIQALEQAGYFFAAEKDAFKKAGGDSCLNVYRDSLNCLLKEGHSYPEAREAAYREVMQRNGEDAQEGILSSPNNILGIEYIKAAAQLHSHMKPVTVLREGMGYNDSGEGEPRDSHAAHLFFSATAIRERMREGSFAYEGIPQAAGKVLSQADCYLEEEHFWTLCSYAIRNRWEGLGQIKDVSPELANRFRDSWYPAISMKDFAEKCKTKNVTMSRIRRCIFQVLLGVEKTGRHKGNLPYLRLLGMRRRAAGHLKRVSETVILARLSRDMERLGKEELQMLSEDIMASDVYRSVGMSVSGIWRPEEYKRRLILI